MTFTVLTKKNGRRFCFSLFMNSALKKKNLFKDRNTKIGVAGSLILLKVDPKLTEIWENLLWISMGFGSAE